MNGWRGPELGLNGPVEEGRSLWCEANLRVPDHFAGMVLAWDIVKNALRAIPLEYAQVLYHAICDRPNVCLVQLHFDWQD